jgi:Cytotoxic/Domain of unknown function (DUF4157)
MMDFDRRASDDDLDLDVDVMSEALGSRTLVASVSGGSDHGHGGQATESSGPTEADSFDFTSLVGGGFTGGGGMATAVLEQEPEADDLALDPRALFEAATAKGGTSIPHKAQMEQAFGRPFDDVTAHLGTKEPLHAMDAEAAAGNKRLAFDSHDPSPEQVAHELAHVEQDRKAGGGDSGIHASGAVSERGSASELEAERVSALVASGQQAPAITAAPDAGIQRSFISFAIKMGAKKASKGMLKNFIKTRIKDKIKDLVNKKVLRELVDEADQIMGILEDPWWVTAIGFVPVVGDAFDLYNVPKQIRQALSRADALEDKAKKAIEAEQAARRAANATRTLKYIPAPKTLRAFPNARAAKPKTPVQGGGKLRARWKDDEGNIFEWDSQHGTVERYNKNGKHQGEFDASSGQMTKGPDKNRTVEP